VKIAGPVFAPVAAFSVSDAPEEALGETTGGRYGKIMDDERKLRRSQRSS
jgi:hypothetical protein